MNRSQRLATDRFARSEPVAVASAAPGIGVTVPLGRLATTRPGRSMPVAVSAAPRVGHQVPLRRPGTTRFARTGPVDVIVVAPPVEMAPDLPTAVYDALAASLGLETAFGRDATGAGAWLWYEQDAPSPSRVALPYLIIGPVVGQSSRLESPNRGLAVTSELQATIYAPQDRVEALGADVAGVLRDTPLRFTDGAVAGIWRLNPGQGATRTGDRGHRGEPVWSQILRFRVLAGGPV